jgi:GntR family transcriptional regulator
MAGVLVRVRRWCADDDERIAYAGRCFYRADMFVLDVTHDSSSDNSSADLIPAIHPSCGVLKISWLFIAT